MSYIYDLFLIPSLLPSLSIAKPAKPQEAAWRYAKFKNCRKEALESQVFLNHFVHHSGDQLIPRFAFMITVTALIDSTYVL